VNWALPLALVVLLPGCSALLSEDTSSDAAPTVPGKGASVTYEVQALGADGEVMASIKYLDAQGRWQDVRSTLPWSSAPFDVPSEARIGLHVRLTLPMPKEASVQCGSRVLPWDADDPYDERVVGNGGHTRCDSQTTVAEAVEPPAPPT
jgi:hypothetical protein